MLKRNISFNEELHRYTDEDNLVYTSVTTLIGEYTPKFNKEYWSQYKADQAGISQQEVIKNWEDITKEACDRGTATHKMLEDSVNESINHSIQNYREKQKLLSTANIVLAGTEFTNINIDVLAQSNLAKTYPEVFSYLLEQVTKFNCKLYVEKRTYSHDHLVAGTIDLLLVKGKQFIIVDWKTNKKEMYFKSGYYKKVGGIESTEWVDKKEYMLGPIKHLEHCKGVIYTLQLSLYAYILELWGMQCIGLVLFHLRPNHKPKLYNILYDKMSAELLMIDRKNGLISTKNKKSISNQTGMFGVK